MIHIASNGCVHLHTKVNLSFASAENGGKHQLPPEVPTANSPGVIARALPHLGCWKQRKTWPTQRPNAKKFGGPLGAAVEIGESLVRPFSRIRKGSFILCLCFVYRSCFLCVCLLLQFGVSLILAFALIHGQHFVPLRKVVGRLLSQFYSCAVSLFRTTGADSKTFLHVSLPVLVFFGIPHISQSGFRNSIWPRRSNTYDGLAVFFNCQLAL